MECLDYCESLREHQMLYYESMNHIIDFSKKKKKFTGSQLQNAPPSKENKLLS